MRAQGGGAWDGVAGSTDAGCVGGGHCRTGHGHTGKVHTGESRTGAGVAGGGIAGGGITGGDNATMAGRGAMPRSDVAVDAVDAKPSDAALLCPRPRRRHEDVRGVDGRHGGAHGVCGRQRQALSGNDVIVLAPRPQRVS